MEVKGFIPHLHVYFILFYFFCIIFDCGKIFQDGHNPMFKIIKRSDSEMND